MRYLKIACLNDEQIMVPYQKKVESHTCEASSQKMNFVVF